jgi:hypothetical protein
METVKNINGLLRDYSRIEQDAKRSKAVSAENGGEKSLKKSDEKPVVQNTHDKVEISSKALNLLKKKVNISEYLDKLENITTLDDKKLNAIRLRLETDYYVEPAIIQKIVRDLIIEASMVNFNAEKPAIEETKEYSSSVNQGDTISKDLSKIQENVQSGAYYSDDVMSKVASQMLAGNSIIA